VRRRPWVVLLLVLGLGGLRALASATLPDPVWVPGLYDDADYDDVVLAVLDLDGSCSDAPPALTPSTRVVARVLLPAPASCPATARPTPATRAPPAA